MGQGGEAHPALAGRSDGRRVEARPPALLQAVHQRRLGGGGRLPPQRAGRFQGDLRCAALAIHDQHRRCGAGTGDDQRINAHALAGQGETG